MNACAIKQHGQRDTVVLDNSALFHETQPSHELESKFESKKQQLTAVIIEAMA